MTVMTKQILFVFDFAFFSDSMFAVLKYLIAK